jgi:hypothetical protein
VTADKLKVRGRIPKLAGRNDGFTSPVGFVKPSPARRKQWSCQTPGEIWKSLAKLEFRGRHQIAAAPQLCDLDRVRNFISQDSAGRQ